MFMYAGCSQLPAIHRAMIKKGYGDQMLIEPGGYLAVLRKASSKTAA